MDLPILAAILAATAMGALNVFITDFFVDVATRLFKSLSGTAKIAVSGVSALGLVLVTGFYGWDIAVRIGETVAAALGRTAPDFGPPPDTSELGLVGYGIVWVLLWSGSSGAYNLFFNKE